MIVDLNLFINNNNNMHVEKILLKKLDYGFEVLEKGTKIIITKAQAKQMAKDGYIADEKKNTNNNKKIKENGNK
tara:strand:+ start:1340 stop:1561 length:222 start_codon:yes stop_codon:yes gene_type:complete